MKQFLVFTVIACMAVTTLAKLSCTGKADCTIAPWSACEKGWQKQTMTYNGGWSMTEMKSCEGWDGTVPTEDSGDSGGDDNLDIGGNVDNGGGDITGGGDKEALCLASANSYRELHQNTNNLTWDAGLASKAQAYAVKLLAGAIKNVIALDKDPEDKRFENWFKHDKDRGKGVGENLSWVNHWNAGNVGFHCRNADKNWYAEINDYDWNTGESKVGYAIGHFTQMAWAGSKKVGYGVAVGKIPAGKYKGNTYRVVVARYTPPGNYEGQFKDNVHPCKDACKHASDT